MAALGYANRNDYYVHILGLHSGVEVKFKAILGSFSDTLTSNYNSEEIYGRIDPIMTFQGVNRKIAMTLEVPAARAEEAQQNFQSLSRLMSSMYLGNFWWTNWRRSNKRSCCCHRGRFIHS